jgi:hypothetical protein
MCMLVIQALIWPYSPPGNNLTKQVRSEGSMLQLYALAILHVDKRGVFPL